MKTTSIIHYSIPLYLTILLAIFLPYDLVSILCIIVPMAFISIGIYRDTISTSFIGLGIFYLFTLPRLPSLTYNDSLNIFAYIVLLLVPTLFFICQMLQHHDIMKISQRKKRNRVPFFLAVSLFILVLLLFYSVGYIAGRSSFFSFESVQSQILLIVFFSLVLFLPFILKPIKMPISHLEDSHTKNR